MYQVDDYVVCGNKGPCVVESIGPLEFNSSGNLYYTLVPLSNLGSKIFIPIEKEESRMRPVLSKEEAMDLLDHIGMIEPIGRKEKGRNLQKERKWWQLYESSSDDKNTFPANSKAERKWKKDYSNR